MNALFGNNSYPLTRDIIPLSSENSVVRVTVDFAVHQILELVRVASDLTLFLINLPLYKSLMENQLDHEVIHGVNSRHSSDQKIKQKRYECIFRMKRDRS
jgi:hypothetical protein